VNDLEPGRTLTLMVCGRGNKGQWGYIDPDTGEYRDNEPDPTFLERAKRINPRMFWLNVNAP
jgi:hypothetical protein